MLLSHCQKKGKGVGAVEAMPSFQNLIWLFVLVTYFLVDKTWNRGENSMNVSDCCNNCAQILCLNCPKETLSHLLFTYLVNRKKLSHLSDSLWHIKTATWVLVQQYWHTGRAHGEYFFLSVCYKYRGRPIDICESGWGRGREKEKHRSASNLVSYWPSLLQHRPQLFSLPMGCSHTQLASHLWYSFTKNQVILRPGQSSICRLFSLVLLLLIKRSELRTRWNKTGNVNLLSLVFHNLCYFICLHPISVPASYPAPHVPCDPLLPLLQTQNLMFLVTELLFKIFSHFMVSISISQISL